MTVRENRRLQQQLAHYAGYLEREQRDPIDFGELAGDGPLEEGRSRISMGADVVAAVGSRANGSEKEVVARAVHGLPSRRSRS